MKKLFLVGFVAVLATSSMMTSCSKYDEGSNFTLMTKKSRVINEWNLVSMTQDGTTLNMTGLVVTIKFLKDGTYSNTTSYTLLGQTYTDTVTGTWSFSDDKTKLITIETGETEIGEWTIIQLAKDDMKLSQFDASNNSTTITVWATK
jgi:hypothetical protein